LTVNNNAPNFQDYINYLEGNGFIPIDICELHMSHGALVQIDILFITKSKLAELNPEALKINHFINF
jgi:hypothetical protein